MLLTSALRGTLRRLRTRPLRTLLTLLQVLLGALAMTLALSAYLGTWAGHTSERFILNAGSPEGTHWSLFRSQDISQILALAPDVKGAALFGSVFSTDILYHGQHYEFRSAARVTPDYFKLAGIELTRGSFFTASDARQKDAVAVLSDGVAHALFGAADPIGQTFTQLPFSGAPHPPPSRAYRVIGTFAFKRNNNLAYGDKPTPVYFPAWFADVLGEGAAALYVRAKPGRGKEAREEILAAVREVYKNAPELRHAPVGKDFYIAELDQDFRYYNHINPNVFIFGLFGIIALIIGTIGIFSSTVVDVTERTHEIGIRRSLGASSRRISVEFMTEAGLLALIGGLIGVGISALVIPLLAAQVGSELFQGVNLHFQPLAGLAVLVVVIVVSAGLGLFPALQAGRMKPIEALREV